MKNEKGHLHTHAQGGLCHTNDDHYSLEPKGRGELDSMIPFTKICPPHVVIPEHLKHAPATEETVNRNADNNNFTPSPERNSALKPILLSQT